MKQNMGVKMHKKEQIISERAIKALRQNRKIFCPFCREYEKTFISKVAIGLYRGMFKLRL